MRKVYYCLVKVVRSNQQKPFENGPTCGGYDFPDVSNELGAAVISVNGRYPEQNFLVNEKTNEMVYVISGRGTLLSPSEDVLEFTAGDVVYVGSNEVFAWLGEFTGFFANTPPFDPAQHTEVVA
jgi:mannose-6-phosphate isomerase-like protein (cupin superfamily)